MVDNEVDKSIQNLCDIASKSMQLTDKQILEIMLAKRLSINNFKARLVRLILT